MGSSSSRGLVRGGRDGGRDGTGVAPKGMVFRGLERGTVGSERASRVLGSLQASFV